MTSIPLDLQKRCEQRWAGRRGKPGGPPRGTEALPCCERLEENPRPGLTCWGFLLWLFQGK